jgi:hypothetical protein
MLALKPPTADIAYAIFYVIDVCSWEVRLDAKKFARAHGPTWKVRLRRKERP